jgi:hypothetical protein
MRSFAICVALLIGLAACQGQLDESLTDLQVGDCIKDPGVGVYESLEKTDCSEPNTLLVVGRYTVSGYGDIFPGAGTMEAEAGNGCPTIMKTYLGPTKDSWEKAGDRLIICFV